MARPARKPAARAAADRPALWAQALLAFSLAIAGVVAWLAMAV